MTAGIAIAAALLGGAFIGAAVVIYVVAAGIRNSIGRGLGW